MAHPEGIVFGDGDHLPDANALAGLDRETFFENLVEGDTTAVAHVPGHPGSTVRLQSPWRETEANYWTVVKQGIRHFQRMEQAGIIVPAQRFVLAPGFDDDETPHLYSFTDYLEGRQLTNQPADAHLAAPVIDGLAKYMRWAYNEPTETEFLWDKIYPWQFTVRPDNSVILHDVGLDFRSTAKTGRYNISLSIYQSSISLEEWADQTQIKTPQALKLLMSDIEPPPIHAARKLIRKVLS